MPEVTHDEAALQALSAAYTEHATETAKKCLEQILAVFPMSVMQEAFQRLQSEHSCG